MQPVTIEAKPAVRVDLGRSITAAASGSASFAALLLETGTGSREPVVSQPPAGKGEPQPPTTEAQPAGDDTQSPGGEAQRPTDQAAGEPDVSDGDVEQPGTGPQQPADQSTAAVLALVANIQVPPTAIAQTPATATAEATAPAPAALAQPLATPAIVDPGPGLKDAAADGATQTPAAPTAEQTALPSTGEALASFEEVLASVKMQDGGAAESGAGKNKPAGAQGAAQPVRVSDAAQAGAAAPAQTSQPQTGGAVEAAVQPSAAQSPEALRASPTASDTVTTSSGRSETATPASPFSAGTSTATADAAAPAAPRAPVPMPAIHNQLAVHIQRAVSLGTDRITIHLSPAELGRIDVRLEVVEHGRVSATVAVERPETLDLLQRDSRGLERALQDAGLKTDAGSLSFSLRDDGRRDTGGRQPFESSGQSVRQANAGTAPAETTPAARTVYGTGALDIRV